MSERIQKVLARAGYGSRRQLEALIKEGKVTVNGEVAKLGDQVDVGDNMRVDGKAVSAKRLWHDFSIITNPRARSLGQCRPFRY